MGAFENSALRTHDARGPGFEQIVGESAALEAVLQQVERVAPTTSTVLIQGAHSTTDPENSPAMKLRWANRYTITTGSAARQLPAASAE